MYLPVGFPDLGTGQRVADHPARHRHGVQAVADGGQHVRVPHPVDVQRGAELRVLLRGRGDRGEEGEPVLLISEEICINGTVNKG